MLFAEKSPKSKFKHTLKEESKWSGANALQKQIKEEIQKETYQIPL
jgi:hypothetical protein